jgi:hypothetical protein
MNELAVDHLAYVSDRHYRRRVHASLRRTSAGRIAAVNVQHEGDNICCLLEPWQATARRLMVALAEDGERPIWAFAETHP